LEGRRAQIEALTAAITATTNTLRAHSAAAAASSVVLERERRLVAAETALMATQVGGAGMVWVTHLVAGWNTEFWCCRWRLILLIDARRVGRC
jgi:hypothetical protein